MKPSHSLGTLALVLATGCPSDHTIWLAPLNGETAVQLQDNEPSQPY